MGERLNLPSRVSQGPKRGRQALDLCCHGPMLQQLPPTPHPMFSPMEACGWSRGCCPRSQGVDPPGKNSGILPSFPVIPPISASKALAQQLRLWDGGLETQGWGPPGPGYAGAWREQPQLVARGSERERWVQGLETSETLFTFTVCQIMGGGVCRRLGEGRAVEGAAHHLRPPTRPAPDIPREPSLFLLH